MSDDKPTDDRPGLGRPFGDRPSDIPRFTAAARAAWEKYYLPKDPYYRLLTQALSFIFVLAAFTSYYIGAQNQTLQNVVFWVWRTSLFGVWSNTVPYNCGYNQDFCFPHQDGAETSFLLCILFIVGGLISLRLCLLALQLLERALGINVISRLLNKFLPEKSGDK